MSESGWNETVDLLRTWDGTVEGAGDIRSLSRTLAPLCRPPVGDVERALALAVSSVSRNRLAVKPGKLLEESAEFRRAFAPFVGDERLGIWPFHDPFGIPDEEAVLWLKVVGTLAPVDDRARLFVEVMFRCRVRRLWVAASEALQALARRDPFSLNRLVALWQRHFPDGVPREWAGKSRNVFEKPPGERHECRHTLHAIAGLVAGGVPPGAPPDVAPGDLVRLLVATPLPKDDADASTVLLCIEQLCLPEAHRGEVERHIAARASEAGAEEQGEAALRAIAETLGRFGCAAAVAAVERRLREPRWTALQGTRRLDALWSWMASARWFQGRGKSAELAEMSRLSPLPPEMFTWFCDPRSPGPRDHGASLLVDRLRVLLDPDSYVTTPGDQQAALLAETLFLIRRTELRGMPWRSLAARALGAGAPPNLLNGSAGEVGEADIARLCLGPNDMSTAMIRDVAWPRDAVLALVSSRNGFIHRQVAVQLERLLRECGSPDEQVRLLWRVLQSQPHRGVFARLREILRSGAGAANPLEPVLDSLIELHRKGRRGAGAPTEPVAGSLEEISGSYRALAGAIARLGGHDNGQGAPVGVRIIRTMADDIDRYLGTRNAIGLTGRDQVVPRMKALKQLVIGDETRGLDCWMKWLGTPLDPGLPEKWEHLESRLEESLRAGPTKTTRTHDLALEALADVSRILSGLAWPEREVVEVGFASISEVLGTLRGQVGATIDRSTRLDLTLRTGSEEDASALVCEEMLSLMAPEDRMRLHGYLLSRLHFGDARSMIEYERNRPGPRVVLKQPSLYMLPLLFGLLAGPFLTLDVGNPWNETIPRGWVWAWVAATMFAASFALIGWNLTIRVGIGRTISSVRHILVKTVSVLVPAAAVSFFLNFLLLASLEGTGLSSFGGKASEFGPQLVLWTSLSLFLGLFLGLLMQGKGLFDED